ncbi:hypothetical protein MLD38_002429 [Melastoma candidum]|uniref:Uncharacterized protein n=1 Tax=Melastoma candidum TaxID=119954 RepID=A0ACB9S192_9MYRT|nr:hypothetical protein MLD38_002429 [Melastoma candidum]
MEAFTKTMAVKLRSHHDKYLLADDDRGTVRQSRTRETSRTTWVVEPVEGRPHLIRLRSVHGTYLTGSDTAFLLGVTGKKVVQSRPDHKQFDWSIEWEPVREGFQFRLRSWCGKFLRANGGTPPWRNTVTHDDPQTGTTTNWILWDVDSIDARWEHQGKSFDSAYASSLSNLSYESGVDSPALSFSDNSRSQKQLSPSISTIREGMDFFRNAKAVRLRSHHDKYLIAEDDEESVSQLRNGGSSPTARWSVEFVLNSDSIIRLKSCHGKYLTASNQPFLLGMTGRKVLQTHPRRLDSSVEWEPVRDGTHVRLKTRYGNFLRANSGPPPWRNSVTHDVPHRSSTQEWVLWDVDVIEIEVQSPTSKGLIDPISHLDSMNYDEPNTPSEASNASGQYSRQESSDSYVSSPPKSEGKTIYYHIAGENGEVDGEDMEGFSMNFKGNTVDELTKKLEEETGIQDIFVCSRSPLNGKLFPLRLQLPPNIVAMHVVVVPRSSVAAEDF